MSGGTEEEEFFLGPRRLYVVHHRGASREYAILLPPIFEELSRTRKILVNLARDTAASGRNVLRFDYLGTGLSDGDFGDFHLDQARADLDRLLGYCVEQGARSVTLFGFRFGGYLALSSLGLPGVERVVAWEPILDLGQYFRDMLRVEMSNQLVTYGKPKHSREELLALLGERETVLVDGYPVRAALLEQFSAAAPLALSSLVGRCCSLVFWEGRKQHEEALRLGLDSRWADKVKFSWRHIRFLEPRSEALFRETLALIEAA